MTKGKGKTRARASIRGETNVPNHWIVSGRERERTSSTARERGTDGAGGGRQSFIREPGVPNEEKEGALTADSEVPRYV